MGIGWHVTRSSSSLMDFTLWAGIRYDSFLLIVTDGGGLGTKKGGDSIPIQSFFFIRHSKL